MLVKRLRVFQTGFDQVNLGFGRPDSGFRFLLKCMENVDHALQFDRVDRPKRIPIKIRDDLDNACAVEAFQRLRVGVLFAFLGRTQSKANA